jgi:hypothetical protein
MPRKKAKAKARKVKRTVKAKVKRVSKPRAKRASKVKQAAPMNDIKQMNNVMSKPTPIITKQMVMEALVRMNSNLYKLYNGNLLQFNGNQWVNASNVPNNHVQQARTFILNNMK